MNLQRYKFCTKCGTKLTSDTQFCANCGTKTIENIQEPPVFQAQPSQKSPNSNSDVVSSSSNGEKDFSALFTIERIQKEFFTYQGRLNRLAYFLRLLIVMACAGTMLLIMEVMKSGHHLNAKLSFICYAGLFLCTIAGIMLGIRRCHDLNRPSWFIGLAYIPVVGIIISLYILFTPGTKGINAYGPDPLEDRLNQEVKLSVEVISSQENQPSTDLLRSKLDTVPSIMNLQSCNSADIIERIKKEFFSYRGRLNRLAYFQRLLIVSACIGIGCVFGAIAEELLDNEELVEMLIDAEFVLCAVAGTMLGIRRCHDLDKSGWFIGLAYIPIVGIFATLYIWFVPGTNGTNKYGEDPLQNVSEVATS